MATTKRTGDSPSETTASSLVFVIEVLQIIREAQQQHGLRHGDYQRYRQYCTHKLERLRNSLHFAQAVRSKMQPKRVIDLPNVTDVRFFHVTLFLAERAWSFAMQLKAEANTEPRKRFHLVSRLRKAVRHADELTQLAEKYAANVSPRSKLEIEAYAITMRGTLAFERRMWQEAREALQLAKAIYERLGKIAGSEGETMYTQKSSELTVQVRFCAYQLGDQHVALADLAELKRSAFANEQAAGATNETLRTLIGRLEELVLETGVDPNKVSTADASADDAELEAFRAIFFFEQSDAGRARLVRVPVRVENARYFLLAVRDAEKQPTEAEADADADADAEANRKRALDAFENTLKRANDVAQELRDAMRASTPPAGGAAKTPNAKRPQAPAVASESTGDLGSLLRYVQLVKLAKTVERNQLILEGLKPSDVPFGVSFTAPPSESRAAECPESTPAQPPSPTPQSRKNRNEPAADKRPDDAGGRQQLLQQAAKLHDSIVQSLEEMLATLPPPPEPDASTVAKGKAKAPPPAQEDDAAGRVYENMRTQLRVLCAAHCALRYFCLAETFSGWRRHAEALYVSSYVRRNADEALGQLDRATADAGALAGRMTRVGLTKVLDARRLAGLRDRLALLVRVVDVQRYLYAAQYEATQAQTQAPAAEPAADMSTTLQRIATPGFIALPTKPMFYDLAANALTYDPVIEQIATTAQPVAAQQKKAAGGLTGFVKGWIWGSGSAAK